jgi:hypothetical protein
MQDRAGTVTVNRFCLLGYYTLNLDGYLKKTTKINNSVALFRERTIPTKRPPLVGEVSANFCRYGVSRGQRDGSLRPYSRDSRPEPLLFLSSSSSIVLTRPFQTHYFSENLVAPGIETGPLDLQPGTLTTRPKRRRIFIDVSKYLPGCVGSQEICVIGVTSKCISDCLAFHSRKQQSS